MPTNSAGCYVQESFKNKVHERKSLTRDIHSPTVTPPQHTGLLSLDLTLQRDSNPAGTISRTWTKKQTAAEIIVSAAVLRSGLTSTSASWLQNLLVGFSSNFIFLFPLPARHEDVWTGQALSCLSFRCDQTGCSSGFFLSVVLRVSEDKGLRPLSVVLPAFYLTFISVEDSPDQLELFFLLFFADTQTQNFSPVSVFHIRQIYTFSQLGSYQTLFISFLYQQRPWVYNWPPRKTQRNCKKPINMSVPLFLLESLNSESSHLCSDNCRLWFQLLI